MSCNRVIVLGSASPRRQHLLAEAGVKFEVRVADVPEIHRHEEEPEQYVQRLAKQKALTVLSHRCTDQEDICILAADTIVVCENKILEKPENTEDAMRILQTLRNRAHEVMTGVCILCVKSGKIIEQTEQFVEKTRVFFGDYSDQTIFNYIATGEPMDKAGAYGIQGIGGALVEKIEGSYSNVVGLPLHETLVTLEKLGILPSLIQK